MLDSEIRKQLMEVIEANLPAKLTNEQAIFWVKNTNLIPSALENLAKVAVLKN